MSEEPLIRLEEQVKALSARLDAVTVEHRREHEQDDTEVIRAAAVIDKRLEGMNELRSQITAERAVFVTRDLLDSRIGSMNQRVDEAMTLTNTHFGTNASRIEALERTRANLEGRFAMLGAVLLFVSVIINLAIAIVAHFIK